MEITEIIFYNKFTAAAILLQPARLRGLIVLESLRRPTVCYTQFIRERQNRGIGLRKHIYYRQ